MAVITFQNPKGGSSKTTSALILATTLAQMGQRVALIDSDPNAPLVRWAEGRQDERLTVAQAFDREVMSKVVELHATHDYVVIDTEGTAHMTVGYALARTDLAIMPISLSQLDVDQAGRAIGYLEAQGEVQNRKIPYRLLFTKTTAAFQTRVEKAIRQDAAEDNVVYFETTLVNRQAFIEMFVKRATLWELESMDISGVPRAIENAIAFAREVAGICKELSTTGGRMAA
jgi:ATPases involved in chromosome partitioning